MPLAWRELLDELRRADLLVAAPPDGPMTTGVGMDSRSIESGMIYVAVRGSQADGHRFVADAVRRGAVAVVVESAQRSGVPEIIVRDGRRAALALGQAWYGHPGRRLTLLGVTGTNGKTTTVGILRHLFNASGRAGSIGTLGAFDGAGRAVESTAGSLTTPGPIDLQATLAELVSRGTTHVAMEASSHSLDQGRLEGLTFRAGVFTNLTRDHLDYHGTMEAYLAAKLGLSRLLGLDGVEVVNLDDGAWQAMGTRAPRTTFGLHPAADVRASGVTLDASGSRFRLDGCFGSAEAALPLLGDFNVSNALAAAATALALGHPLTEVVGRLAESPQVPGRMERIADTPVHRAPRLRPHPRRARARARDAPAAHAAAGSSWCSAAAATGIAASAPSWAASRRRAPTCPSPPPTTPAPRIRRPSSTTSSRAWAACRTSASSIAWPRSMRPSSEGKAGDTILLAGKGHETYQVLGTEKVPFDEREIVRAAVGGRA